MATTDFIAAVELGSSHIAAVAGQKHRDGSIRVLAYAKEDASKFMNKGVIYNIEKAAQALTSVVNKLEEQLGSSVAKMYVGIGGQSLRTVKNVIVRTLSEDEDIVSQALVDRLFDENRESPIKDMDILDVAPQEYQIDNTSSVDPVGVAGRQITGKYLNIVARSSLRKNLEHSFQLAKVNIADVFISPLALAHAVLSENEMRAGCALVDLGAQTTTVSVYKNNILRYLCVLPLGGDNITRDITSLKLEDDEAEQLKLHYGDALYEEAEGDIPVLLQSEDGRSFKLSELNDLVGARAEEIMSNVWNQIRLSCFDDKLLAGVFFTGGGCNLKNLDKVFYKLSGEDKVKTCRGVRSFSIQGFEDVLLKDGEANTLLGLLALGRENCCLQEVEPEPVPVPEPPKPKPHEETVVPHEEKPKTEPVHVAEEKPEEDEPKKKNEKLRENGQKKGGSVWRTRISSLFNFDNDDSNTMDD